MHSQPSGGNIDNLYISFSAKSKKLCFSIARYIDGFIGLHDFVGIGSLMFFIPFGFGFMRAETGYRLGFSIVLRLTTVLNKILIGEWFTWLFFVRCFGHFEIRAIFTHLLIGRGVCVIDNWYFSRLWSTLRWTIDEIKLCKWLFACGLLIISFTTERRVLHCPGSCR